VLYRSDVQELEGVGVHWNSFEDANREMALVQVYLPVSTHMALVDVSSSPVGQQNSDERRLGPVAAVEIAAARLELQIPSQWDDIFMQITDKIYHTNHYPINAE